MRYIFKNDYDVSQKRKERDGHINLPDSGNYFQIETYCIQLK